MNLRLEPSVHEQAEDLAAKWFARWRSGRMTDAELAQMEDWLGADVRNREAFEDITALWGGVEPVRADPRVLSMREAAKARARRSQMLIWGRRAAAVLAMAMLGFGALRWAGDDPIVYSTGVGQTSTVGLADGSRLVLDTDSAVKVWPRMSTRRRLELVRGRAYFQVAKDRSRPFVVQTDRGSVTALGTAFDVRQDAASLKVVLVEGRVRIKPAAEAHSPPVEMAAGHEFIADQASWRITTSDAKSETSWTKGELSFDEQPLSEIVREINRYTAEKIVIVDPQVGRHRLSAVLKTNDTAVFLDSVTALKLAQVRRTGPRQVQLLAP